MAVRAHVKDIDLGWNKLKGELKRSREHRIVRVGVQGSQASADHDGISNVGLAAVHEFGAEIDHPGGTPYKHTGAGVVFVKKGSHGIDGVTKPHKITIPERSFIRSTIDENTPKYAELSKKLLFRVIDGKITFGQALGLFGARVKADIQRTIQRGIAPELAPSTVARKGSSKPLIDKGQLKESISYEVGASEDEQ